MKYIFQIKEDGTVIKVPKSGLDIGLDELQKAVGGYIEVVPSRFTGLVIICDEEGKLKGQGENLLATHLLKARSHDYIVGDAVLLMERGEELLPMSQLRAEMVESFLTSLTNKWIKE